MGQVAVELSRVGGEVVGHRCRKAPGLGTSNNQVGLGRRGGGAVVAIGTAMPQDWERAIIKPTGRAVQ